MYQLIVNRKNFHDFTISAHTPSAIGNGQLLLKINQFAFTANNITYAVAGDTVGYWKFFPVSNDEGIIPVWGFADVVESKSDAFTAGERIYGYYPMASHIVLEPIKIKNGNFTDGSAHRIELPQIYNRYLNTKTDSSYSPEGEAFQSIFRPLFTTSFLLDDFFFDNNFFDAKNIILTSASSKTAIGMAFLLAKRKASQNIKIIGLTSKSNVTFVTDLGFYDQVISYDNIASISTEKSAIVDFAGNNETQETLQNYLGDALSYNCLVGMTDWKHKKIGKIKGIFFFAPTQAVKRTTEWGPQVFQQKLAEAWLGFTKNAQNWVAIKETTNTEDLGALYLAMLNGKVDPSIGHIVNI